MNANFLKKSAGKTISKPEIRGLILVAVFFVFSFVFGLGPLKIQKAEAAIALVATSTCSAAPGTSISCTLTHTPTNGNALIAVIGARGASSSVSDVIGSISETGASWSEDIRAGTSTAATTGNVNIWSAINVSGASTAVTINLTTSTNASAIIGEYSGIAFSGQDDKNATSSAGAVNPAKTGTTAATTQASELWVGGLACQDARRTYSAPTGGFTIKAQIAAGSTTAGVCTGYLDKIVSATGVASSSATMSTAATWFGAIQTYKAAPTITIANGTNPAPVTVGPTSANTAGANATTSDVFTFATDFATSSLSSVNVNLSTSTGIYQVLITNSTGGTVYGSSTQPGSTSLTITTSNLTVSSTATTFNIRISPLSYSTMPSPPNADYVVTSTVASWVASNTNLSSGSNTTSSVITIDNSAPADVTNATGTAGASSVTLSWTNPSDPDFATTTIARTTSTSGVTWSPTDGQYYTLSSNIGATNTIACVLPNSTSTCVDSSVLSGIAYYYKIFTADTYLNYSSGAADGPFTPGATVSCTVSTSTTAFAALDTAAVYASSPIYNVSSSCTYGAGCTIQVNDTGGNSLPGLYKSVSPTYLIQSATATLSAGTEGYGIQATTTTAGTGTLNVNSTYNVIGNSVGGLSLSALTLASSSASYSGKAVQITTKAAVAATTYAGAYADTITYSCTGN